MPNNFRQIKTGPMHTIMEQGRRDTKWLLLRVVSYHDDQPGEGSTGTGVWYLQPSHNFIGLGNGVTFWAWEDARQASRQDGRECMNGAIVILG
jgi:hypothetical protein